MKISKKENILEKVKFIEFPEKRFYKFRYKNSWSYKTYRELKKFGIPKYEDAYFSKTAFLQPLRAEERNRIENNELRHYPSQQICCI